MALLIAPLMSCSMDVKPQKVRQPQALNLHVPSPDWREQVIYLAMIDRFDDGDAGNNDQGRGEYDPTKESHFSGGDIQGLINRLDYLQELGMTSLWITPPVANQWWDPEHAYGGYHGYWARDFSRIDEHFGDVGLYKQLSHGLHQRHMYLMQDIVVNHTGNFFAYPKGYNPQDVSEQFELNAHPLPSLSAEMSPFDLNDARDPAHREAGIYHFTPSVSDINSQYQEFNYQLGGLDDINTENPRVIDAFKQVYGYWLNEVGVDAFRIDTVKYVDHPFWREFLHGPQGIKAQARDQGKENFLTLGEVKLVSEPLQTGGEEKIAAFLGTQQQPELDTVFAFPLQEELNRVFAAGRPTQWLAHRLKVQMHSYRDPSLLANFVDNHDVPRFISGGSQSGLKQALALIFTIPGIPVIYQGNEQGAHDSRQAMFAGGYLGQDGGSFDTHSEMFRFIQALTKLRREHKTLIHGKLDILASDTIGPGVLAYKRSRQGQDYYVIFNSAEHQSLLNNLPTGLAGNSQLEIVFSHGLAHREWQTDAQGGLTAVLPARTILVLKATGKQGDASENNQSEVVMDQNIGLKPLTRDQVLTGSVSSSDARLLLVIDGNLQQARSIQADEQGRWQTTLTVRDLGTHQHRLEVYAPELNEAAPAQFYTSDVSQPEITLIKQDPQDDDRGRLGNVSLPEEKTFKGQLDLVSAEVRSAGSVLELTIKMDQLTDMWIASNGFDHVCLSLFIDVPGQSGLNYLPELQASLPSGQEWDFAHVAYGWGNYLYTTQGAEPGHGGTKIAGAPQISVDKDKRQIRFVYSSLPFGIDNWQGVKFYISTWDRSGEGGLRTISPEGGAWEFKGPDIQGPLIMDEMMFTLPLEE